MYEDYECEYKVFWNYKSDILTLHEFDSDFEAEAIPYTLGVTTDPNVAGCYIYKTFDKEISDSIKANDQTLKLIKNIDTVRIEKHRNTYYDYIDDIEA